VSNIHIRLLFFFFAFPALVGIILLPHGSYAAINTLAVIVLGLAALETGGIFKNKGVVLSRPVLFILGAGPAASVYLGITGILPLHNPLSAFLAAACLCLLGREIFYPKEEDFQKVLPRLGAYFFVLLYPGFFGAHFVLMTRFDNAGIVLMIFVAATYLNDSFAWLTGVLWGKGTQRILTVSPNKSLVGFIFGFAASVLVISLSSVFLEAYFPLRLPQAILLGAVLGLTSILGDLAESALKRSADVKDSGALIPGRGGLLDSIDSPLFNAPVFFYFFSMLTAGQL
jgi:phosphatidate cytidylyltransferase